MHAHTLILLRGLPGSGKSELARLLSENGKHPSFSVDDYFTKEDGSYEFLFSENHKAYRQCENATEQAMQGKAEKILIHNTFTLEWEMEPYFRMAAQHAYRVYVLTVENRHQGANIHEVTREQLEKMAEKYKVRLLP